MITPLLSSRWDYELYDINGQKVLTVIFFAQIDYPRSFYLEEREYLFSPDELSELAEKIRMHYEIYKYREIIPTVFI